MHIFSHSSCTYPGYLGPWAQIPVRVSLLLQLFYLSLAFYTDLEQILAWLDLLQRLFYTFLGFWHHQGHVWKNIRFCYTYFGFLSGQGKMQCLPLLFDRYLTYLLGLIILNQFQSHPFCFIGLEQHFLFHRNNPDALVLKKTHYILFILCNLQQTLVYGQLNHQTVSNHCWFLKLF